MAKKSNAGEEEKNPVGRPLAFDSQEELQAKIDEYFAHCDNRIKEVYNKELGDHITISNPEPYTMGGLGVFLGVDRQTILNYEKKDEYFGTIKAARARVEADVERRMNDKETFTPGLIFNAKNNFGWKDKSEVDMKNNGGDFKPVTVNNLHGAELDDSLRELISKRPTGEQTV